MKIISCFKVVPDDQDIVVRGDRTLDFSRAAATISTYDLNAIEAGVQLAEEYDGEVIALSVGGTGIDDSKLRKNVLSRGPASLALVADDATSDLDTHNTAQALKAALEKIGEYDLVLCGDGSADVYAQQVGIQLGELLGIPVLNSVNSLRIESGTLVAERTLEDETQTLDVMLPAVISVTSDSYQPRIATMKQILAAGKKPVTLYTATDIEFSAHPTTEVWSTLAPRETDRKHDITEGDTPEAIAAFALKLTEALR
jgi:electron transfer flavoprotein beta subunit